jgi:hypothetical protein
MKHMLLFLVLLFGTFALTSLPAHGQSLAEGSVVSLQVEPNPVNGSLVWNFETCCGDEALGHGGFLGNGFAYTNGTFSAFYKYPGQKTGYGFGGTIGPLSSSAVTADCVVQSAEITDAVITEPNGTPVTGLVANYVQLFCQRDGVIWVGPGGFSVHAQ